MSKVITQVYLLCWQRSNFVLRRNERGAESDDGVILRQWSEQRCACCAEWLSEHCQPRVYYTQGLPVPERCSKTPCKIILRA